MVGRGDFAVFILVAGLVHVAALAVFGPSLARAPEAGAGEGPSLRAADPALAELVELWNTPPETGDASALAGPGEGGDPPDAAAAEAEQGVDAASEVAALGETSGPGKAPKRPIFAAPPKANTTAPPKLALKAPDPGGFTAPTLASPSASSPGGFGSGFGGSPGDGSPGGSLAGLGGGGLGGGLALPDQPIEESFAPETAPVPLRRPTEEELAAALAAQPEDADQPSIVVEGAVAADTPSLPDPSLGGGLAPPSGPSSPGGLAPLPPIPEPEPE
ncbi:MAG: hypothetical protein AAF183_01640 [Pseudomonadota bacterium]